MEELVLGGKTSLIHILLHLFAVISHAIAMAPFSWTQFLPGYHIEPSK